MLIKVPEMLLLPTTTYLLNYLNKKQTYTLHYECYLLNKPDIEFTVNLIHFSSPEKLCNSTEDSKSNTRNRCKVSLLTFFIETKLLNDKSSYA